MTGPGDAPAKPIEALFRPALVLMSGRLLGFVVAFFIPMILARTFDQSEFGTYKQVFLIFGTLFGIAQLGMAESLYYFLPSRPQRAGQFVFNTMLTTGLLGLFSLCGLWLFRTEIATLMNNPQLVDLILPIGVFLMFMLMAVVLEIILTVRRQFAAASGAYAITDVARAIFYITPVMLLGDVRALVMGAVVLALARFAATLFYVRREFGAEFKPDRKSFAEQARYAVPFGFAGIIEVAQGKFHMYAVSYAFDAATFAIYAVGCLQIPLTDYLMTSTSNVMMVNMRNRLLEGDLEGAIAVWLDGNRKLAMVLFPLAAGLLVMAQPFIILLFTDSYAASVPIFMMCTLGVLLAALMTDSALRVFALTRFLIFQNFVRLCVVVLFMHWFLDQLGLIGAVIITLLADALVKVLALGRILRELKVSPVRVLPWKAYVTIALLTTLAALPAWLIVTRIEAPEIVLLMIAGPVFLICYYLLVRFFGPLQRDEKEQLSEWVRTPLVWLRGAV